MGRTLGLDVGANSIGWSLLDLDARQIIASGVRIFPEGVDNFDTKKEQPKMAGRRVARGMRRQIARRRSRKGQLRNLLISVGLLPASVDAQRSLNTTDPYSLRRRALSEPLTPHELGRLIVHLNQRRGFKSNRKTNRGRKADDKGMLGQINQLAIEIEQSGSRTLGELLAKKHENPHLRIRNQHTRRDMFEREFELCWTAQTAFHSSLLTVELKRRVHKIIFFQRPMYWPASVVGRCELEPRQRRCPRADRLAQRFRLLQEVNNLRYYDPEAREERALASEQRMLLLDKLSKAGKLDFEKIRKELGFIESISFNLERGKRKSIKGMPTDTALAHKDLFGKEWYELAECRKNEIVRKLIDTDDDKLPDLAAEWGLPPASIDKLAAVDLPDGYASLSRIALEKLLPHMERGLLYMTDDNTPCALSEAGYLRPDQMPHKVLPLLPEPPDIANPVVRQAIFELRKLVNAVIHEYGKPDHIHIELARNATMSMEDRQKASTRRQENEDRGNEAADLIRDNGFKVSRDGISRVLLWKEQNGICVYSGRPINVTQLLQGEADFDHILPYSRCLDDSMQNKVVAFRSLNQEKGKRTPREWLESDPDRYNTVLQCASRLNYAKRKRFTQKELDLDAFVLRQLNDTRYIAREAARYLRCIVEQPHHVLCPKGSHTAVLRRYWGLNTILRSLTDSPAWTAESDLRDGEKDRSDHRHHAIDALVIALTDQSRLHQLALIRHGGGTEATGQILSEPGPDFRKSVTEAIAKINVSYRVRRRVSGALHDDTIYGPVRRKTVSGDLVVQPGEFVVRKKLIDVTPSMVEDIRDDTVKAVVKKRLDERKIAYGRKAAGSIPKAAWVPDVALPSGVPIRRVRLKISMGEDSVARLGDGRIVAKGSNHHIEVFLLANGDRAYRIVSTFDAAARIRDGKPVIDRVPPAVGATFLMSLSINEMILIEGMAPDRALHRVQKMDVNGSVILRPHTYSGRARDTDKPPMILRKTGKSLRGRKVTVDPLGRIRWAND